MRDTDVNRESSLDPMMEEDDDTTRATVEIRTEIEQTRAELVETVEAIEQKLRPSAVVARAKESVKETAAAKVQALTDAAGDTMRTAGNAAQRAMTQAGRSAGGVMGMMRDNPVPAALIAIGTGWLLTNARRGRRGEHGSMGRREHTSMGRGEYTGMDRDSERYWGEMNTHQRSSMDMSSMRHEGQQIQAYLRRMTSENPLLVGAGALLIGAAFGLALPETESENALMGDARDSLVGRAQQMASTAAERLQDQASDVADAAGKMADSLSPRSQG